MHAFMLRSLLLSLWDVVASSVTEAADVTEKKWAARIFFSSFLSVYRLLAVAVTSFSLFVLARCIPFNSVSQKRVPCAARSVSLLW